MNKLKKLLAAALALVLLCALLPSAALAAGNKYPIQVGTFQYGTVTVGNDATEAEEGDTVELTIVPSSGYKFVENSLKITGPANQTVPYDLTSAGGGLYRADFTMPGHAVSVSVQFTAITFKVFFSDDLFVHGSVRAKVGNGSESAVDPNAPFVDAPRGASVVITAVPDNGYQLTGGSLSATSSAFTGANGVYTLTMPSSNVTVSGGFTPAASLAVASVANASVTASFGSFTVAESSSRSAPIGSTVTVKVVPDAGYAIDYVRFGYKLDNNNATVELTPDENGVCTFRMPDVSGAVTVTAAVKAGDLTVSVATGAGVAVSKRIGSASYTALPESSVFAAKSGDRVSLLFDAGNSNLVRSHSVTYKEDGKTVAVEHTIRYSPVASNHHRVELTFTMPDAAVSVDVQFGAGKTVYFTAMENGTLKLKAAGFDLCESVKGEPSSETLAAPAGAKIEIYAAPDEGYALNGNTISVTAGPGVSSALQVFYDKDGGYYWFTMPEAASVSEITVSAEFATGLKATVKSVPYGGKAEAYVTSEKTAENLLAVSSLSADAVSSARLAKNDVVYVYTTPDPGCSVKDISVSYTLNGRAYTMTTNGTTEATRITWDSSYSAGGAYRFWFVMPDADVAISVTYDAPLLVTGINRTSDTEAEVTFKSDSAGTYYYVVTTNSALTYSTGDALRAAAGGTGTAAAAGTGATPVTNTIKLTGLQNRNVYIHIVVADRYGTYSNIVRAEIPTVSHGVITSGSVSYSLRYDISGTILTVTGITGNNGADVTDAVAAQFAATKGTTTINLADCGTLTQILIPYSIIAPFSSELNESAVAEALEVDFNGNQYGFRFDSKAISELAAPLSDKTAFSYVILGIQNGTYASLTAAQKTFIDGYTAARVLVPTAAYMNYDETAPVYGTTYPAFTGNATLLAVHEIDKDLTPLGVTGYEIATGGGISQARYTYTALTGGTGYISFKLRSVPAKLVVGYWTNPFSDIAGYAQNSELYWAYEAAKYNEIDGRFKGMADGTFSPMTNMNTAQLVTALYRVYYGVDPDQTQGDYWYTTASKWAITSGIISADDFDPSADVTREQFVTMFYRTLRLRDSSIAPTAAMKQKLATAVDYASISAASRDAVAWAVGSGLISGTTADVLTIDPTGHINRIQVCQMLRNYYTKVLG